MQIWELFEGFDKAHGTYDLRGNTNGKGKAEGRAFTVIGPATPELWASHLAGQGHGLGVIPLLGDNTVRWSCLDVDVYNLDHAELIKKIELLGLPLVVCRSKSGGAHCLVFFKDREPASEVRPILEEWAALLGHGGCEIFPKQVERYDEKDIGNWLNMPYYNATTGNRYCIRDGRQLTLDEFVQYAESRFTTLEDIKQLGGSGGGEGDFVDGPPCLQHIQSFGGFVQGTKKDGMFNVGIYLKKRYPDDWQDKLYEYNKIMCNPPLKDNEIKGLIKQLEKKAYSYRCKLAPINAYCRRSTCLGRTYGVGESPDNGDAPEIGSITQYKGNPPLWELDIEGQKIELTTAELFSQTAMRLKIGEKLLRCPALVPRARWEKWLDNKLKTCITVDVPEEASSFGQFQIIVNQYLTGLAQAKTKSELAHRFSPYRNGEGEVLFRSRGLLDYLNTHNFKFTSEHHVWQMLRKMGAKHTTVRAEKVVFHVWVLPDPGDMEPEAPGPEFGTKEF